MITATIEETVGLTKDFDLQRQCRIVLNDGGDDIIIHCPTRKVAEEFVVGFMELMRTLSKSWEEVNDA